MQYPNDYSLCYNTFFTLPKPQSDFEDNVNNCDTPFLPSLKHPAIRKAILSSMLTATDHSYSFPHPFSTQMHTIPSLSAFTPPTMKHMDQSKATLVDTMEKLGIMISELKKSNVFAIEVLNHSFRSYQGFTCLIILSTEDVDYVVDAIALRSCLHILSDLLHDKFKMKLVCNGDLANQYLQRDFSLYLQNSFDLIVAAKHLKKCKPTRECLIEKYCQVMIPDKYVNSDWRIRPLTPDMLYYARACTRYTSFIFGRIRNEIADEFNKVHDISNRNLLATYCKPRRCDCIKNIKSDYQIYDSLPSNKQKLFENLILLRDDISRHEDESTQYVMPNTLLINIVLCAPHSTNELMYLCQNFIPPLVIIYYSFILRLISQSEIPQAIVEEIKPSECKELPAMKIEATPFKDKTNSMEIKQNMATPVCKTYEEILKNATLSSSQKLGTPNISTPEDVSQLFKSIGWNNNNLGSSTKKANILYNAMLKHTASPSSFLENGTQNCLVNPNDVIELMNQPNKRSTDEAVNKRIEDIISKMQVKDDKGDILVSPPDKLSMIYEMAGKQKRKFKAKQKGGDSTSGGILDIVNQICEIKLTQKSGAFSNKENQSSFFKKIGWYSDSSSKKGYLC